MCSVGPVKFTTITYLGLAVALPEVCNNPQEFNQRLEMFTTLVQGRHFFTTDDINQSK